MKSTAAATATAGAANTAGVATADAANATAVPAVATDAAIAAAYAFNGEKSVASCKKPKAQSVWTGYFFGCRHNVSVPDGRPSVAASKGQRPPSAPGPSPPSGSHPSGRTGGEC